MYTNTDGCYISLYSFSGIPPTRAALEQPVRSAIFQEGGGHIWGQTLPWDLVVPVPSEWGWQLQDNGIWSPCWTILPQAKEICYELIHYGCKKGCIGWCKCLKANLTCTGLCKCGGNCQE